MIGQCNPLDFTACLRIGLYKTVYYFLFEEIKTWWHFNDILKINYLLHFMAFIVLHFVAVCAHTVYCTYMVDFLFIGLFLRKFAFLKREVCFLLLITWNSKWEEKKTHAGYCY